MRLLKYILGKEELIPKLLILNIEMFKKRNQHLAVLQPSATVSDTQSTV